MPPLLDTDRFLITWVVIQSACMYFVNSVETFKNLCLYKKNYLMLI